MMFNDVIKRLENALQIRGEAKNVLVIGSDLQQLIYHFKRVNNELRELTKEQTNMALYTSNTADTAELLKQSRAGHEIGQETLISSFNKELLELWTVVLELEVKRVIKSTPPTLQITLLKPTAKVPTRGSDGAIGWDLYVSEVVRSPLVILAGERQMISTGISVAIPRGYYGRIAPRSGLALKQGINILGGVIDADYRGEINVILHNTTDASIILDQIKPIAQLILERADQCNLMVVDSLPSTSRGAKGFGSSDLVGGPSATS